MDNGVFNVAKGKLAQWAVDHPNSFGILLLKEVEAEGDLENHADLASLLAASGNTEADFTNYTRKTGLAVTSTVDQANDETYVDISDVTWADAGGIADNNLVCLVVFRDEGGTDSTRYPVTFHDFPVGTGGGDLSAVIQDNGYYAAQ